MPKTSPPAPSAPVPVSTGGTGPARMTVRTTHVSVVEFRPSARIDTHRHERACVSIVLSGRFEESFGGRAFDCLPGTLLAKPPGEPHSDRFSTHGSMQIIIEPDPLEDGALAPTAPLYAHVHGVRDPAFGMLGRRMAREIREPDSVSALALEALVLDTLATGARMHPNVRAGAAPAWLRRAREILHDGAADLPDVRTLASHVGVHPAHLSRCFRTWFGVPVGEYARRLRIDAAAHALAHTDQSLACIGVRAGFADQSHFTRTFKRYTGVTPLQYRRTTGSTRA